MRLLGPRARPLNGLPLASARAARVSDAPPLSNLILPAGCHSAGRVDIRRRDYGVISYHRVAAPHGRVRNGRYSMVTLAMTPTE